MAGMPVAMMIVPVAMTMIMPGVMIVLVVVGMFMGHAALCPSPADTFHPFDGNPFDQRGGRLRWGA